MPVRVFTIRTGIYKIGVMLLLFAGGVFISACANPYWTQFNRSGSYRSQHVGLTLQEGLWIYCYSIKATWSTGPDRFCGMFGFDLTAWFHAVRILECLCVVFLLVAGVYALFVNCCKTIPGKRSRFLEVVTAIGGVLGLTGVSLYVAKRPHNAISENRFIIGGPYASASRNYPYEFWDYDLFDWGVYKAVVASVATIVASVIICIGNKALHPLSSTSSAKNSPSKQPLSQEDGQLVSPTYTDNPASGGDSSVTPQICVDSSNRSPRRTRASSEGASRHSSERSEGGSLPGSLQSEGSPRRKPHRSRRSLQLSPSESLQRRVSRRGVSEGDPSSTNPKLLSPKTTAKRKTSLQLTPSSGISRHLSPNIHRKRSRASSVQLNPSQVRDSSINRAGKSDGSRTPRASQRVKGSGSQQKGHRTKRSVSESDHYEIETSPLQTRGKSERSHKHTAKTGGVSSQKTVASIESSPKKKGGKSKSSVIHTSVEVEVSPPQSAAKINVSPTGAKGESTLQETVTSVDIEPQTTTKIETTFPQANNDTEERVPQIDVSASEIISKARGSPTTTSADLAKSNLSNKSSGKGEDSSHITDKSRIFPSSGKVIVTVKGPSAVTTACDKANNKAGLVSGGETTSPKSGSETMDLSKTLSLSEKLKSQQTVPKATDAAPPLHTSASETENSPIEKSAKIEDPLPSREVDNKSGDSTSKQTINKVEGIIPTRAGVIVTKPSIS